MCMKGFLMLCLLGFIVYSVYYVAIHDKKLLGPKIVQIVDEVKTEIGLQDDVDADIYCALHALSPEPNSHVASAIVVSVLIDNTNTDCAPWVIFEGQGGTIELYDEYGKLLDTSVLTTTSDWTTGFPSTYTATLANFTYTGKVKLRIKEEDPSGQNTPKESYMTLFVD